MHPVDFTRWGSCVHKDGNMNVPVSSSHCKKKKKKHVRAESCRPAADPFTSHCCHGNRGENFPAADGDVLARLGTALEQRVSSGQSERSTCTSFDLYYHPDLEFHLFSDWFSCLTSASSVAQEANFLQSLLGG